MCTRSTVYGILHVNQSTHTLASDWDVWLSTCTLYLCMSLCVQCALVAVSVKAHCVKAHCVHGDCKQMVFGNPLMGMA